jgi:hypothetical protein
MIHITHFFNFVLILLLILLYLCGVVLISYLVEYQWHIIIKSL